MKVAVKNNVVGCQRKFRCKCDLVILGQLVSIDTILKCFGTILEDSCHSTLNDGLLVYLVLEISHCPVSLVMKTNF